MKTKYWILLLIFVIASSFTYGYFVSRHKIFPHKIIKQIIGNETGTEIVVRKIKNKQWYKKMHKERYNKIIVVYNYQPGYYIFTDKWYVNNLNDEKIIGKTLIQISRHRKENIEFFLNKNTFVYRVISDENDNSMYDDWTKTNFNLEINGLSSTHKEVIKKYFLKGAVKLNSGGPTSADPIFLDISSYNDIEIKTH